jgi:hypothetical protein
MEKKIFTPHDWLQSDKQSANDEPQEKKEPPNKEEQNTSYTSQQVAHIIRQLEDRQIDITTTYPIWRDIGFALSDAFGEEGRDFFHRISRLYPAYNQVECNKQYDNCLKSKKEGITIATFIHHAKNAGVSVAFDQSDEVQHINDEMPTFPEEIFENLPELLKRVVAKATSPEEKDLLLLGSLAVFSACLPNMYGIYDSRKVYANLYVFITARASAGKGRMVHCRQLVQPVHNLMREKAKQLRREYDQQMQEYNQTKGKKQAGEKPAKPPEKMLVIPANNSTTGLFQLLFDNDGKGLIFETEGDTMAQAFKSDYGNYSDGFRKAFHHETISYYRRTDREYVDIAFPRLSALLSATHGQIATLIPNAENGLFSRFLFYFMNIRPEWKDVFADTNEENLDAYFSNLGNYFFDLYQSLERHSEINFCLAASHKESFNSHFAALHNEYLGMLGLDYMATVRRLGLITFRMCMILSALRLMGAKYLPDRIICEERDFQTAMAMVKILVQHSAKVFSELPQEVKPQPLKNLKERFFDSLPATFCRQDYIVAAGKFGIPEKTAEYYITGFVRKHRLHREKHDFYIKPSAAPAS